MFETHIKFGRLATAIMMVFIISDLMPHPSLSSGIIATTLSEIQELMVEREH